MERNGKLLPKIYKIGRIIKLRIDFIRILKKKYY